MILIIFLIANLIN